MEYYAFSKAEAVHLELLFSSQGCFSPLVLNISPVKQNIFLTKQFLFYKTGKSIFI